MSKRRRLTYGSTNQTLGFFTPQPARRWDLRMNPRNLFNMGRSWTNTRTRQRRKTSSGRGVTNHFDRSRIYSKRRMPRRRRRNWVRFSRKVNAVSEKDLGSRTVVRNSLVGVSHPMDPAGENQHGRQVVALYPLNGTTAHMQDINEIQQDTDLGTSGKAIFKSAVLDLTVRNTSARLPDSDNPEITLEVDVYELTANQSLGQTGKAVDILAAIDEGSTDTATIPGQVTALTGASRGWTPWDFPSSLSEYRIKIWKKTKFFLSENQTFTYQVRNPKRYVLDKQRMNAPGDNLPRMTRYVLFIYKPAPGYVYSTPPNNDLYGIGIGVTRKYMYKIYDKTQDYDMYNT